MDKLTFHKASYDDVSYIAANMFVDDVAELHAAGHTDIEAVLYKSIDVSKTAVVVKCNGVPQVIYGLNRPSLIGGKGVLWMLNTTQAKKHRSAYIKFSRQVVALMLEECNYLYNYVHARNTVSIKWLKLLGFTIEPPSVNDKTGEEFHKFWIKG